MQGDLDRILVDAESLRVRVKEIGEQISRDYADRELLLIGILRGAAIFLADLLREITIPVAYDFMAISSYGQETHSSGVVRILKDLDESVEGKHILVVEDIVDTGLTLRYLLDNLHARQVASVRVCTLLDKPDRRQIEVPIDYLGFSIPNLFVVGYGMDFAQRYRNLPFIGILREELTRSL